MPKRYIIALIIIAVLFIGGIFLIISLLNRDAPDSDVQDQVKTEQRAKELSKDTEAVVFTTYGKVVGEEDRRAIKITVTANERKIEILQGYDEISIKTEVFDNKESAFDNFLIALDSAGFDKFDAKNKVDDRSQCSIGRRYVYQANFSDDESIRSWSTSCGDSSGSFEGRRELVRDLFKGQIPDYSKVVSGVRL